jgi:hypothetical protein
MTHERPTLSEMLEKFDHAKHGGEFPGAKAREPGLVSTTTARTVFGLIERDVCGSYQGRIIGFEHITFTGSSAALVEQRLSSHVAELIANGTLALETEFESVVPIGAIEISEPTSG